LCCGEQTAKLLIVIGGELNLREGHSRWSESVPNELQIGPDEAGTDLLQLPCGLPVSLHWGEQGIRLWILILGGWNLRQGVVQAFQIS